MTLRIDHCVLKGTVRNDMKNTIDGWLEVRSTRGTATVLLALVGNLPGHLAGQSLHFINHQLPPTSPDSTLPDATLPDGLQYHQIGVLGSCSLHRNSRTAPTQITPFTLCWHGPDGPVNLQITHSLVTVQPPQHLLDLPPSPPLQPTTNSTLPVTTPLPSPAELPNPDLLPGQRRAWLILKPLLARLAQAGIAFHLCPHCTSRDALRQITRQILPKLQTELPANRNSAPQSFSSAEYCTLCQQEFAELQALLSDDTPEKPRNPQKLPFPVSGSGPRIWNSGTSSTSMVAW
jgi:hypothetical protein